MYGFSIVCHVSRVFSIGFLHIFKPAQKVPPSVEADARGESHDQRKAPFTRNDLHHINS